MEVLHDAVRYFLQLNLKTFVAVTFLMEQYLPSCVVFVNKATRDCTIYWCLDKHILKK